MNNDKSPTSTNSDTPVAPSLYGDSRESDEFTLLRPSTSAISSDPANLPMQFGHFRLESCVGEGGAGIVFRARDERQDRTVALKVLKSETHFNSVAAARFNKESVMQASVNDRYVAQHLEFDQIDQTYYIASEFVVGVSADSLIGKQKVNVPLALKIVSDLLRGLDALHRRGMVHRDVKPGNLLLVLKDPSKPVTLENFDHAKLTDFGLARHVDQSKSMELTHQRSVLGTPLYMAPEQYAESRAVDSSADIYAVGGTLFHFLAGEPPFRSSDLDALAAKHRDETPRPLFRVDASLGEAVSYVVAKALEKSPAQRYASAAAMLHDVECILDSRPIQVPVAAKLPSNAHVFKRYCFEYTMEASVSAVWPLVADTDRFNKAIGLPTPDFKIVHEGKQKEIRASAKFNGTLFKWLEHPFRWVVERELSVLREFECGPFKWIGSEVKLAPLANGRTRVQHEFCVEPRGLFGKLITPFQYRWTTRRSLNRVYGRIEELAKATQRSASELPFGEPVQLSRQQQDCLDEKIVQLSSLNGDVTLAEAFGKYLATVSDRAACKIRPIPLAQHLDSSVENTLSTCVHAVNAGLVKLLWEIICPVCRVAAEAKPSLADINSHEHCRACNEDFEVNIADAVEIVFCVHPSIREANNRLYCIGGPYHAPHVLLQNEIEASQHTEFAVTVTPGAYSVKSPQLDAANLLLATEQSKNHRASIQLNAGTSDDRHAIAAGPVSVCLKNGADVDLQVRLEQQATDPNVMTAVRASENQEFRELFPDEIECLAQLSSVTHVHAVLIGLCDSEKCVAELGDVRLQKMWSEIERKILNGVRGTEASRDFDCLLLTFEGIRDANESLAAFVEWADSKKDPEGHGEPLDQFFVIVNSGNAYHNEATPQGSVFGECVRTTKRLARKQAQPTLTIVDSFLDANESDWISERFQKRPADADLNGFTSFQLNAKS